MRSLFLFLLLLPFFSSAALVKATIKDSTGQVRTEVYDDKIGQKTRYFERNIKNNGFGWISKLGSSADVSLSSGAKTTTTLPAVIEHQVEKKAIMRGLFQNAKSVGKAAAGLAGKRVWFLMALGYAAPHLAPEGWLYNEDEMEFQKIINSANPHYFIIQSNKSFGYSFPEGGGTKLKVQQICGALNRPGFLGDLTF